jgi:HTH-type transcriptional regulator / antitoxin HipB
VPSRATNLPIGHSNGSAVAVRSSAELGALVRAQRKRLALKQLDIAGLGNTGNRFIVDLENGKPTVQLQKVLDIMALLGLELVVRLKSGRSTGPAP